MKNTVVIVIVLFIVIAAAGCMTLDNFSSVTPEQLAFEYLEEHYDDTFTLLASDNMWPSHNYYAVYYNSEQYDGETEVRVPHDTSDGTGIIDNYYMLYMKDDAVNYLESVRINDIVFAAKIRFHNWIWSDDIAYASSFEEWKDSGTCTMDIMIITDNSINEDYIESYIAKITGDGVNDGTAYFIETEEQDLLSGYSFDEVIRNQDQITRSLVRITF